MTSPKNIREEERRIPQDTGKDDRDRDRGKKQEEQLRAARKRDMYMIGGFIAFLLIAVLLISIATKDTRKEILNTSTTPADSEEEEGLETPETVVDIAGKNPEPTEKEAVSPAATETDKADTSASAASETTESTAQETSETLPPETEETAPPETETAAPETAPPAADIVPPAPAASSANVSGRVIIPTWVIQDFLNISPRNRPGIAMPVVHDIVVHWVANPNTTAKGNRDYFNDLAIPEANLEDRSASAHFVVGLEGEIIQCIPLEEIAYANYPRNEDTISIEVCHPDWNGQYNSTTYASLIRLVAYLCQQYGLNADHVIRHHDVSGKDCPKYYVEHPDAWEQLKRDVTVYMSQHPDILREFP